MGAPQRTSLNRERGLQAVRGGDAAGRMTDLVPLLPAVPATWTEEGRVAGILVGGKRNRNTAEAYASDLRLFFEWSLARGLVPLTARREHIDAWVRDMEAEGRTAASVLRRLSVVQQFYEEAEAEGLVTRIPTRRVQRPRLERAPSMGIDADQARSLLRHAAEAGSREDASVCLLLLNGLRVSELCGLRVQDFTSAARHAVVVVTGKGGKVSRARLAPQTIAAIRRHLRERGDVGRRDPLVARATGSAMDRFEVGRMIRRLAREAGVPTGLRNPHELRHTFVTLALAAGVRLDRVQRGARHADPKTTFQYERELTDLEDHATIRLAEWLAEGG
jgi:integrase/recombinase XerD